MTGRGGLEKGRTNVERLCWCEEYSTFRELLLWKWCCCGVGGLSVFAFGKRRCQDVSDASVVASYGVRRTCLVSSVSKVL